MEESLLILTVSTLDKPVESRLAASRKLGDLGSSRALSRLKELNTKEKDDSLQKMFESTISRIESWQSVTRGIGHTFSGLSLGSILILMALGLSIIFGLMGVINMAHGELMMIGAYATFLTQKAFEAWMPASAFDWYFVCAIPVSFLAAGLVGFFLEWAVVRHLYGRPLDTMLATFGVSFILIQIVRLQFGDNIAVNSPSWLQGGYEVMPDVVLPYNRCFIIAFCLLCIGLMYFIMEKTKLGLLLRATTQNRGMAASLGVQTRRIDGYTFALGAGLAGMAGCALTQIGGVTPDMGQNYIVDSFMVVVTGGVGKLAGAIWAGLGLGCLNKFFEPYFAAVWGKVLILVFVVVFLQWRPSGLFPAKGRLADA
jgi:urea transport system permease protein